MFVLELGVNHLGSKKLLNNFFNFFIKSSFKMVTIMMQSQDYYIKNPNHVLKNSEYENMIKICKKNNKKIGLAVCDILTFSEVENLNFDFYKLLSVSNTNIELINILKSKKNIYIFQLVYQI